MATNGLAQTFYVDEPSNKLPGVFLTKLDLFFKQKPSNASKGITVSINYVENGFPTEKQVPFSSVRLLPSSINVSDTGLTATSFVFEAPVYVQSQQEYAIYVSPDGGDIGYEIWVSEVGKTDTVTNKQIFVNSSTGTLFTSANGRQWSPYQNEDMKFKLYRANFSSTTATIKYTNANTEFVLLSRPIADTGARIPGGSFRREKVFVSNGAVTVSSNTVTSIGNTSVNVYPANASAIFTANKMIYLRSNNSAQTDVRTITSVPNANTIIVNQSPTFNDSNASIGYLYANGGLYGFIAYTGGTGAQIYESTANSTVNYRSLLANGGASGNALLIGQISGVSANLSQLVGASYSEFVPQFAFTSVPGTTTQITMRGTGSTGNTETSNSLDNSQTTVIPDESYKFIDKLRIIRSRSDELYYNSGTKSLEVTATLTTTNTYISPMFDDIKSSGLTLYNLISVANSSLIENEKQPRGSNVMRNKYISKPVLLTQEAEDLVVYLTAYRPLSTELYVFCKLMNQNDPDQFNTSKYWTLMEEVTPKPYSSKANLDDIVELQYKLPTGTNSSNTVTAFVNTDNNNIVRYYTDDGSFYDGYSTYSIKIVLAVTNENTKQIVPRVRDMRAIAVQA